MSTMGVDESSRRNVATIASTSFMPTLCASARSEARWITGPSAIGSEKGTPSSIKSAPASTSACSRGTVTVGEGSPAVTYGISAVPPELRRRAKQASMRFMRQYACNRRLRPTRRIALRTAEEMEPGAISDRRHVLVAAPGEIHEQDSVACQRRRETRRVRKRVARFERRNDAFEQAAVAEGCQRLVVGNRDVLCAPAVLEPRMLGPDAWIIEAGRDRVSLFDLTVRILKKVRAVPVEHAWSPSDKRGSVPSC